jgi:hypothetical protein
LHWPKLFKPQATTRTTAEDWAVARRWLARELAGAGPRES